MTRLHQIQGAVRLRTEEITAANRNWPCRKGCDDCCQRLASTPRVSREEWRLIAGALSALPADTAALVRGRIRASAAAPRPVVCPLLDTGSGSCLVYPARPVACRAYGFYAERQYVLGCSRIESMGLQLPDVVWGNHTVLEELLASLGTAAGLAEWLATEDSLG